MQSIAMTKILGFRDREIAGLYLVITSMVVIVSLIVSVPIIDLVLRYAFEVYLYKEMFMMIKIGKIKKSEALKNLE